MRRVLITGMITSLICVCLILGIDYFQRVYSTQLKIGTTYMTLNNNFYKTINDEIKKQAVIHQGVVLTRDPALSASRQVTQIHELIEEGVNVLIINPVDGHNKKIQQAMAYAKNHDVRTIVIDTPLSDSRYVDTTIVSNNYQAGVLCAKNMMKNQSSAKIFLLEHRQALSAVDRIRGFTDTIKGHKHYRIVGRRNCLGQTDLAMAETQAFLKKKIAFNTLMSLNDPATLGALAAFEERHLQHIAIYSVDGSPELKKIMSDMSVIQTIAAQSPLTMAKRAFACALQLYHHQHVKAEIVIPVTAITQHNINNQELTGWS